MIDNLHTLDVEIDGLVVKVNDFATREQLGSTSKSPRWLIAYKWEKYEAVTRVEEIGIQVGKTGALTPVAHPRTGRDRRHDRLPGQSAQPRRTAIGSG